MIIWILLLQICIAIMSVCFCQYCHIAILQVGIVHHGNKYYILLDFSQHFLQPPFHFACYWILYDMLYLICNNVKMNTIISVNQSINQSINQCTIIPCNVHVMPIYNLYNTTQKVTCIKLETVVMHQQTRSVPW